MDPAWNEFDAELVVILQDVEAEVDDRDAPSGAADPAPDLLEYVRRETFRLLSDEQVRGVCHEAHSLLKRLPRWQASSDLSSELRRVARRKPSSSSVPMDRQSALPSRNRLPVRGLAPTTPRCPGWQWLRRADRREVRRAVLTS